MNAVSKSVPEETDRAPSSRRALASLSLATLLASLGTSIANVALPTLARAFDASFARVQWVVLAYLIAITALIVGAGRLGDLAGRRRLMLFGLSVFAAASLACGLAPSLEWLVAARAAQGAGAAVMTALTLAFVADAVPKERTGRAMGWLGTMSAVGTALGPSLGGVLIAGFGWRAIFLAGVPFGMLAFALAYRHLPRDRATPFAERGHFDLKGLLLLALTLAAYALALTAHRGGFGAFNVALLSAAAAGAVLFAFVEARTASPLVRLSLLREPRLRAGFALSTTVMTVMMATLVVGPFYLSGALAFDAARVGLVMSAGPVVSALSGVPAGRLVDRHGAARATIVGLVALAIGCGALTLLPPAFGVAGYVVPLVVVTAGYALFQAANNTAVMRDIGAAQRGVVSGLLNLSRHLGLVTGAAAMGAVFAFAADARDGAQASAEAAARGLRVTFAIATVLVAGALAIAVRRPWERRRAVDSSIAATLAASARRSER